MRAIDLDTWCLSLIPAFWSQEELSLKTGKGKHSKTGNKIAVREIEESGDNVGALWCLLIPEAFVSDSFIDVAGFVRVRNGYIEVPWLCSGNISLFTECVLFKLDQSLHTVHIASKNVRFHCSHNKSATCL